MLAVARGASLGIDVEIYDKNVPLAVARRFFSPVEAGALAALPADAQPRRFLRLWTLKEAYLKAIGTGLAGGLGGMTFRSTMRAHARSNGPRIQWLRAGRSASSMSEHGTCWRSPGFRHAESRAEPGLEWHEFGSAGVSAARINSLLQPDVPNGSGQPS